MTKRENSPFSCRPFPFRPVPNTCQRGNVIYIYLFLFLAINSLSLYLSTMPMHELLLDHQRAISSESSEEERVGISFPPGHPQPNKLNNRQTRGLVSKETVVVRRWGRETQNFGLRANARNVSFQSLYGGQFTLSTQLINPKFFETH